MKVSTLELEGAAGSIVGTLIDVPRSRGLITLLHGGGQTRHSWAQAGAILGERGWSTLAYDARGHGDSAWSDAGDYRIEHYAEDLSLVLQELGVRGSTLVGASLGGMTSLFGQVLYPGIAERLVLVDIVPRPQLDGIENVRRFMTGFPEGFESLESAAAAVSAYQPHRTRPLRVDGLKKNLRLGVDGRWRWHWDPLVMDEDTPLLDYDEAEDAARQITVPTMLLSGAFSDVVHDEDVEAFLKLVPGAQARKINQAGHMIVGDRNDVFAQAIIDFID